MTLTTSGKIFDRLHLLLSSAGQRRCRLQGLEDASLHFGWVETVENGAMRVELNSRRSLRQGELVYVEVSASTALLTFVALVNEIQGSIIGLQVTSEVEERPLQSESRVRTKPFEGQIVCGGIGRASTLTIVDISENGFGFICRQSVVTSVKCETSLNTKLGDVKVLGEVRHARTDRDLAAYRGGVLIMDMDRVSRARWTRLLER